MLTYDLCFAWNWEYDADFAENLASACQAKNLTLLQVTPDQLESVLETLSTRQLRFRAFFDRATDADATFTPLNQWALQRRILTVNRYLLSRRAWNKATMHRKIIRAGLDAPSSICLPPFNRSSTLARIDLTRLGERFAIKPVHGGGGLGVITGATAWEQVLEARKEYPEDHYLLQAHVNPVYLADRPAWFRVIFSAGQIHPFWWDPDTHRYTCLNEDEISTFGLANLRNIASTLAEVSRLELFSTEIAYTEDQRFLVVDYINDPIDLRPQSKAWEGIPDPQLEAIAHDLASYVASRLAQPHTSQSPSDKITAALQPTH